MSEKKKEPEFVVTDRRKFTEEGERRPDVPAEAETATRAGDGGASQASSPGGAKIISEKFTAEEAQQGPEPRAASEAERIADPPDQRRLEQDRKIRWQRYGAACGPGKCACKVALFAFPLLILLPPFFLGAVRL